MSSVLYTVIDQEDDLGLMIGKLNTSGPISIDCEGINLSRTGKLCLIQVADSSKVYIFDVVKLGRKIFDEGLKAILEDAEIPKYFYDCREDCNALLHQYGIDVQGIQDLQVLDLFKKKHRGKRADFVNGLGGCMARELPGCGLSKAEKNRMHDVFSKDSEFWSRRPLNEQSLRYAALDVKYLPTLRATIMRSLYPVPSDQLELLLRYASTRFADHFRRNDKYSPDVTYFRTAWFPLNILPKFTVSRGNLNFTEFPNSLPYKCQACGAGCTAADMSGPIQCRRCRAIDNERR